MAQTETTPGFRLPWAADTNESDLPVDDKRGAAAPLDEPTTTEEPVTTDMIESTTPAPTRKTTKFMADLSRAMQGAAESSRDETMSRFHAESKTVVEEIQAASAVEAADLRRRADDDVAAVREWSKAEIARLREETEARIAVRKTALDGEIDAHALVVDARVQRVAATVESFQAEMDAFFERLMAEDDPTRIATMAETMPDPPDLAGVAATIAEPEVAQFDPFQARLPAAPDPTPSAGASDDVPDPNAELAAEAAAALAARLDFAAAEAEALAFTGDVDDEEPATSAPDAVHEPGHSAPIIQALAMADAGTPPAVADTERTTTKVIVHGLVSVASIAAFKRGLAHTDGVVSVGVASGPDGEFVFTIEHATTVPMKKAVMTLHGFEARVTAESTGTLEVAARDPDTAG